MAEKRDYYDVLGLGRDAEQDDIKKAYRRLTRKYHPDVNKDDPQTAEKFKEAHEAYKVLSDPHKRAQYDRYGHSGMEGTDFGDFSQDFGGFDDIFDMFFGGSRGRSRANRPQRGADLQYRLRISFEKAAFGGEEEILLPRTEVCVECGGSGAKKGSKAQTCDECNGRGEVSFQQQSIFGNIIQNRTCSKCRGEGKIIKDPCRVCNGAGQVRKQRKLKIKIPAGVDTHHKLRMAGEGEAGLYGGPPGDLYILIEVEPHKLFKRRGSDLHYEIPISFVQAILGDEIKVPTLEGKVAFKIPAGSQPGQIFRLNNKGIQELNSNRRGDLLVKIKVVIPKKLDSKQQQLLKEFAKVSGEEINPEEKGFFKKVRDALGV